MGRKSKVQGASSPSTNYGVGLESPAPKTSTQQRKTTYRGRNLINTSDGKSTMNQVMGQRHKSKGYFRTAIALTKAAGAAYWNNKKRIAFFTIGYLPLTVIGPAVSGTTKKVLESVPGMKDLPGLLGRVPFVRPVTTALELATAAAVFPDLNAAYEKEVNGELTASEHHSVLVHEMSRLREGQDTLARTVAANEGVDEDDIDAIMSDLNDKLRGGEESESGFEDDDAYQINSPRPSKRKKK